MTLYPYTLLLHIVGVIGLFIALSLELAVVSRLQAAKTTTQVHEWLTLSRVIDLVLPVSMPGSSFRWACSFSWVSWDQ